jgi:hypothetical protein
MLYFTKPRENQLTGSPTGVWDKSTSQPKFSTNATATLPYIRIISSGAPKSLTSYVQTSVALKAGWEKKCQNTVAAVANVALPS